MITHNTVWQKVKPHIDYYTNQQTQLDVSLLKLQEETVAMFELVALQIHPDYNVVLVPKTKSQEEAEPQETKQSQDRIDNIVDLLKQANAAVSTKIANINAQIIVIKEEIDDVKQVQKRVRQSLSAGMTELMKAPQLEITNLQELCRSVCLSKNALFTKIVSKIGKFINQVTKEEGAQAFRQTSVGLTEHYNQEFANRQNRKHPQKYDYDDYLTEIRDNINGAFNFVFSKSGASNIQSQELFNAYPVHKDIGSLKMWYSLYNS